MKNYLNTMLHGLNSEGNMRSNDLQVKKTGSERRELTRTGINSRLYTMYNTGKNSYFMPHCI